MGRKSAAQVAVAEVIALRQFPPAIRYPERGSGTLLSEWFAYPTLTWAPECLEPNRKPKCVHEGCLCVPKVKAYKQRIVEDVEHKTVLYYARYQCTGTSRKSFSTISDSFLAFSKLLVLEFPYLLTYKTGISSDMFDIVYDAMLSTKGIAGAVANIVRRRQKRFYQLRSRVGVKVEQLRAGDAAYAPPLPPTEEQYMSNHTCLDAEMLKELWLTHTNVLSRLCAAQMTETKCDRVFRMDHSQKFCSKLKVFGPNGSKEQSAAIRMLLLVQNEVGQILGRTLTQSENHAETEALLRTMTPKMISDSDGPRICVCDNANANRNLIERVFGDAVVVKQDPFHVITRFTEKISDNSKKRWLSKQLSAAIYDVERNLRPPQECERRVKSLLESLDPASISVKSSEWDGCVASNLAQIRRGDLYVGENQYTETGGEVRIVSTSQLEAIHSKLRKLLDRVLSVEVGLRILDIFILQHNLSVGAKFRRNPEFHGTDFRCLCQSAVACSGLLPETPQLEYVMRLMTIKSSDLAPNSSYRSSAAKPDEHRPWELLFETIHLRTSNMEAKLLSSVVPAEDIRALLSNAFNCDNHFNRKKVIEFLHLEPEYDSSRDFSAHEFAVLKEVRAEQLCANREWSNSEAVTTILYNCAVERLDNRVLNLHKRGFRAVSKRLPGIDDILKTSPPVSDSRMVIITDKPINDDKVTPDEDALMKNLFAMVRTSSLKNKKQVYVVVFNFAAAMCDGIGPKSTELLHRRWEASKRSKNRVKRAQGDGDEEEKAPAGSGSDLQAGQDTSAVGDTLRVPTERSVAPSESLTCIPSEPHQPAAALTSSASASASAARNSPVSCEQSQLISTEQVNDAVMETPAVTILSAAAATYQLAQGDPDTESQLRLIAESLGKGCKGKWKLIHSEYLKRYPGSKLGQNAVRMRLRDRQVAAKTVPAASTPVVPSREPLQESPSTSSALSSNKRPQPSCASCRKTKRRCGPNSDNQHCEQRQVRAGQQNIASFFS